MVAEYGGVPAIDEGGIKYVLQDWQGSSRAILGQTGVVQARMDYTAFGEEINSGVGQRTTTQGFNAKNDLSQKYAQTERDKATGLDHTWFRKNENKAGRWTSPDPYNGSMSLGNPQSFNRYSYVENEPTNFVDPSGLLMSSGGVCLTFAHGIRYTFADGTVIEVIQSYSTICLGGGGSSGGSTGGTVTGGGGGGSERGKKDCSDQILVEYVINDTADGLVPTDERNLNYIHKDAAQNFEDAIKEIHKTNRSFAYADVFRDSAMQARRRRTFENGGPPANKPYTSGHEAGMAIDVYTPHVNKDVVRIFANHGFIRTAMPKEPWHFQWKGFNKEKIKEAQDYYNNCIPK